MIISRSLRISKLLRWFIVVFGCLSWGTGMGAVIATWMVISVFGDGPDNWGAAAVLLTMIAAGALFGLVAGFFSGMFWCRYRPERIFCLLEWLGMPFGIIAGLKITDYLVTHVERRPAEWLQVCGALAIVPIITTGFVLSFYRLHLRLSRGASLEKSSTRRHRK